jgi:predicted HTH domain antitoxin
MATIQLDLDDELVAVLDRLNLPVQDAARELMVMELYRRAQISEGKAAELLAMTRSDFIQHAADLGIPYFRMSANDVSADADTIRDLTR